MPDEPIAPAGTGGHFESPDRAFTITWNAPWVQEEEDIEEAVMLWNGASSVLIRTLPILLEDCPRWMDDREAERADAGGILDLQLAPEEREEEGGVLSRRSIVSTYRLSRDGDLVTSLRECRRMPDGSALSITHTAFADEYEGQAQEREALLAGLSLTTGSAPVDETVNPERPDEQNRTEVTEPAPDEPATVEPQCVGMEEWVTDTRSRLDRILELRTEALTMPKEIYLEFLGETAGNMAAMASLQAKGPVPPIAAEANEQVISMLGLIEDSAVTQYGLGINPTGNATETSRELKDAMDKADEGFEMVVDLQRQAISLAGECGITVD
jgi:hypothetical protein